MTWVEFEGTIFDRSKVTDFSFEKLMSSVNDEDQDVKFRICANLNVPMADSDYQSPKYLVLGDYSTEESRKQVVLDILAGKYDLPGQRQFVPVTTAGGCEVDYINLDNVLRVNSWMGGLRVHFVDGTHIDMDCAYDSSPEWLREDHNRLYRALGDASWELKAEANSGTSRRVEASGRVLEYEAELRRKIEAVESAKLTLAKTFLTWNTEIVYRDADGGFWIVSKDKAYRLMCNDDHITAQTIGGLTDMASVRDADAFEGKVEIIDR